MDEGLQLNLNFEGDGHDYGKHADWRSRKREARERQLQKRQRHRTGQRAGAGGAASAGTAATAAPAAAHTTALSNGAPEPPGVTASQPLRKPAHAYQQTQAAGIKTSLASQRKRAVADSLHGYGALLQQEQQQQQQKTQQQTGKPKVTASEGKPDTGRTVAAVGGERQQKRPKSVNTAALAADAAAAAEKLTADDEADIMALVALNMEVDQQIQQEEAAALGSSKSHKQQQQVLQGVVEFGDAPDEPDYNTLSKQAAKKLKTHQHDDSTTAANKRHKPNSSAANPTDGTAKPQQLKQQLAQHKVGDMAHAEPNVPAEQRKQLFGDAAAPGPGCSDTHSWQGLGLSEALSAHLVALNFQEPTAVQQQSVPVLLSGRDACVRSPTGSGKTLCYLAPMVQSLQSRQPRISRSDGTHALVLVPTRELAVQVSDVLTAIVRRFVWLVPGMLIGGEHRGHEKARLRKGVTVLVATPGRLLDHLQNTSSFKTDKLSWLVLDEADRLLDLGFEQKLKQIVEALDTRVAAAADNSYSAEAQSQRQTVLLSATLHPGLTTLAGLSMKEPVGVGFKMDVVDGHLQLVESESSKRQDKLQQGVQQQGAAGQFEVPQQLQQKYVEVPAKMRLVALIGILRSRLRRSKAAKLVVFFSNCDSVDFHHQLLQQQPAQPTGTNPDVDGDLSELLLGNTPVLKLHGDMKQPERTSSLVTFSKATSCVLLCTDVAARGLDFPAVSTIIQYDPAGDPAEYVHRVGRTARMGQQGEALIFLLPSEMPYVQLLQQSGVQLTQEYAGNLLQCLPGLVGPGGISISILQFARKIQKGSSSNSSQQKGSKGSAAAGSKADAAALRKGGVSWDDEGLTGAKPEQLAAALLLQRQLIQTVSADQDLSRLALNAFRSFVRAYTTYPSALKHVFHVKSLHLGHLAASFGLREAPKKIGAGGSAAERKKRKLEGQKAAVKKQKQAWHKTAKAAAAMGL